MLITNDRSDNGAVDAITLKDSTGGAVKLTKIIDDIIKNVANLVKPTILARVNDKSVKSIAADFSSIKYKRVLRNNKFYDSDISLSKTLADIREPSMDSVTLLIDDDKEMDLMYVDGTDFRQTGSAAMIKTEIEDNISTIKLAYLVQVAHWTLDKSAVALGNVTIINIVDEQDQYYVSPDDLNKLIKTQATATLRIVSNFIYGLSKSQVIIEMAPEMVDYLEEAAIFQGQLNSGGAGLDIRTGELTGLRGFKVIEDATMPIGSYVRIRYVGTLLSGIVLDKTWGAINPTNDRPFVGTKWKTGFGVIDGEALHLIKSEDYAPETYDVTDSTEAPDWFNPVKGAGDELPASIPESRVKGQEREELAFLLNEQVKNQPTEIGGTGTIGAEITNTLANQENVGLQYKLNGVNDGGVIGDYAPGTYGEDTNKAAVAGDWTIEAVGITTGTVYDTSDTLTIIDPLARGGDTPPAKGGVISPAQQGGNMKTTTEQDVQTIKKLQENVNEIIRLAKGWNNLTAEQKTAVKDMQKQIKTLTKK